MLSFPDYPLIDPAQLEAAEPCVSAVVATYNRAPHPVDGTGADDNPLDWCLRALCEQRDAPLLEVLVVDDRSTDHTADVAARWRARFEAVGVALVFHRLERRMDAHAARNRGAELARGRLLYFLDDDSVVPPHALAGAYAHHVHTARRVPELAALALPVYQRATMPTAQRPAAEIGTLDRERGEVRGGFDCFPDEYAAGALTHVDAGGRWLAPIPVDNLCGAHALVDRARMLEVGGFPVLPTRGYGGETGLALALRRAGYALRMVVDPRVHAVHLRYGNPRGPELVGDDWRAYLDLEGPGLARMVELSATPRLDSGCRVEPPVWYYARLRNTQWLMAQHEPELAARHREHARRSFVERGQLGGVVPPMTSRSQREHVFRVAMADARSLPSQSLEELEARLRLPPISAVLLNYRRLPNVKRIVAHLRADPRIDDITVWNNDPGVSLRPEGELEGVRVVNSSDNSLLARYSVALLARQRCILVQDDDLLLPPATLAELHERQRADPDIVHGIFGRDPRPDGSYALESNQVDAEVDVVLTRCLLVDRSLIARFFMHCGDFQLEDADPPGNGEDILLSYVARKHSGRKNRVHALPVEELAAPHAVHRRPGHREHRTRLMRRCLAWAGLAGDAARK